MRLCLLILTFALWFFAPAVLADDATMLGPSSSNQGSANTGTLNLLQPANPSLQANSDSGAVTQAENGNRLQQAGDAGDIKLKIQGDIDSKAPATDGISPLKLFSLLLLLVVVAVMVLATILLRKEKSA